MSAPAARVDAGSVSGRVPCHCKCLLHQQSIPPASFDITGRVRSRRKGSIQNGVPTKQRGPTSAVLAFVSLDGRNDGVPATPFMGGEPFAEAEGEESTPLRSLTGDVKESDGRNRKLPRVGDAGSLTRAASSA